MIGATNKLYNKTWTLNGMTYVDGVFTFPANGFAMANCTMENPIAGHLYYGSVEQKAPSGASFDDRRFEWWVGDEAGNVMTFAYMDGTNDRWVRQSAVLKVDTVTKDGWIMRNFTVNGTAEAYRRNPIIIDLTAAFGAGNEPSAAWVDANMIPSANGDVIFFDVPSTENAVEDRRRMILASDTGVSSILEENDWKTISKISKEGLAAEYWKIGDTKTFVMGGYTYHAQIVGFDHFTVQNSASYGRAKAGIAFQFKECHPTAVRGIMENWYTAVRVSTNNLIPDIPTDLQNVMQSVLVYYCPSTDSMSLSSTYEKLFVPSAMELANKPSGGYSQKDGTQLAFYKAGNSLVKYQVGTSTARIWYTRSWIAGGQQLYMVVASGSVTSSGIASNYLAPIFCV